ncbi:MAG: phage head-tail connector protein [Cohnella sp.]|nr:phage head-tail connector protein [Cohnella sp.]
MAGLKVIAPPAIEPVSLEEVRAQLRIELDDDSYDSILNPLISAAREWCEGYQNRTYITQTLELALDRWPRGNVIELPRPPLQSVMSVTFGSDIWDADAYTVDDYSIVGRIVAKSWPSGALPDANGIKIRYLAGYEPVEGKDITGKVLGTGDGEEQTYTVGPVKLDSVTLYFNGNPTNSFTFDYESGEVTCKPDENDVVTIDYTEATVFADNVPKRVKQAIILLVSHWFENPEAVLIGSISKEIEFSVTALLNIDRVVPI